MKTSDSSTLAQHRALYPKQNYNEFKQPSSKNSQHQLYLCESKFSSVFRWSQVVSMRIHGTADDGQRHQRWPFFKKQSVTLELSNNIVKRPNKVKRPNERKGKFNNKLLVLKTTQKTVIQPHQQVFNHSTRPKNDERTFR